MNLFALFRNKFFLLALAVTIAAVIGGEFLESHYGPSPLIGFIRMFGIPLIIIAVASTVFRERLAANRAALARQYEKSLQICGRLISKRPQDAIAYSIMAYCYFNMNQLEKSIECSDKALTLASTNALAYANRAFALIRLNRPEEALANCEKALELNKGAINEKWQRAVILCARAESLARLKDFPGAMSDSNEAVVLASGIITGDLHAAALVSRARISLMMGNLNSASADVDGALKRGRRNRDWILSAAGLVALKRKDYESALKYSSQAIAINKWLAEAYWIRHKVYEEKGETAKSESEEKIAKEFDYLPYF
jgi:tetratricopeptide (TPR) repeat protein